MVSEEVSFDYKMSDFFPLVGLNNYIDRVGAENLVDPAFRNRIHAKNDSRLGIVPLGHPQVVRLSAYHGLMIMGCAFVEPILRVAYSGVVYGLEQLLK